MSDRTNRTIFDRIKRAEANKVSRSIGLVADDSPFTVTIAGVDHTGLSKLDSYSPTTGDRVYVLRSGRDLTVLGEVG